MLIYNNIWQHHTTIPNYPISNIGGTKKRGFKLYGFCPTRLILWITFSLNFCLKIISNYKGNEFWQQTLICIPTSLKDIGIIKFEFVAKTQFLQYPRIHWYVLYHSIHWYVVYSCIHWCVQYPSLHWSVLNYITVVCTVP